jgi:hypothetical protein
MSRQLGSIPPQTSQPGRAGRPGMMLTNATRHPSAGNADPVEAQPAPTPGLRSEFREPTRLRAPDRVRTGTLSRDGSVQGPPAADALNHRVRGVSPWAGEPASPRARCRVPITSGPPLPSPIRQTIGMSPEPFHFGAHIRKWPAQARDPAVPDSRHLLPAPLACRISQRQAETEEKHYGPEGCHASHRRRSRRFASRQGQRHRC